MEGMGSDVLPPGFRFDPTDEELLLYFLYRKIASLPPCNSAVVIPVLHHLRQSPSDPWELTTEEAVLSQNKWYFFRRVDENGRWTKSGHWDDLHVNQPILSAAGSMIGMKKYFVFIKKEVPKDVQTNWIMEEYHLSQSIHTQNEQADIEEWVVCRVQELSNSCDCEGMSCGIQNKCDEVELSLLDEVFLALEDDEEEEINFPY